MATEPVSLSSRSETSLPDYITNYGKQVLADQGALAARPYETYTGPRVAPMTELQRRGAAMTESAAGAYNPYLSAATAATTGALQRTSTGAAAPYMERAGRTIYENIGNYMNPYTSAVVDRIGALGQRNLTENLLPAISDRFIGAGQFGGSRQAEAIGRSLRDVSEGILAEQGRLLQSGYTEAGRMAGQDLERAGALARTAGDLVGADTRTALDVGKSLAELGGAAQNLGLRGAEAVTAAGAAEQAQGQKSLDLAYEDDMRQKGYPQEMIDARLKTLQQLKDIFPQIKVAEEETLPGATGPTRSAKILAFLQLLDSLAD